MEVGEGEREGGGGGSTSETLKNKAFFSGSISWHITLYFKFPKFSEDFISSPLTLQFFSNIKVG